MRASGHGASEDSDFDWDTLSARRPPRPDQPATVMDRLAWIVLVLLAFGPPLGFALATLLR
ncbi:MAG: hypothetical protein ACXWC6_13375 [Ramlibacter sp.]